LLLLRQSHQQGTLSERGLALNGALVQLGTGKDVLYQQAADDEIAFEITWQDGAQGGWYFLSRAEADVLQLRSGPALERLYQRSLFSDQFAYLRAERRGPRSVSERSEYAVRQHRQVGLSGEFAPHFLAAFETEGVGTTALRHHGAPSPRLRDQVEAWLGELSPGVRIRLTEHLGLDLAQLEYTFSGGGQESSRYRATNVGFGLTYTLPVIIALLAAPPGALVLIENPEAHLHPRGQNRIGRMLALAAAGGVQILVETHSDHVVNGIRLAAHAGELPPAAACFHYFHRADPDPTLPVQVLSPQLDARGRLDAWPDGFFDEFDKSLEQLLG
jgi:predicted ATPase